MSKRKLQNVIKRVQLAIEAGNYVYTGHAQDRLQQREITRLEVKQVLKHGHSEKAKDFYDENFNQWNYAIRGKTIDQRKLRVVISFDDNEMLVITVIDLDL